MTALELLAPAKNLECGKAAIDHGADAVYIGANRFGARVAAANPVADIAELCRYAHPFGAKVYATVNTLLFNDELEAARQLLDQLAEAGVDAVLVQDMALLSAPLTLHASTQTDNRSAEKVAWLRDLGFRRVVLARECSIDEIAAIHRQVPDIELEVFVHGALCVSYSGLCYASEYCFGRSANRGACAQFCRMPFDLVDADRNVVEHDRHLLSLRDLNLSDHLEALAEAGATSFKIEGRLKDISYVKNVTAFYSERLNQLVHRYPDRYTRASQGHCRYTFQPDLSRTFNRGYTTYFAHGRQPDIASFDTPKAIGQRVGTVKQLRRDSFSVAGTASFANGDGLCFFRSDRQLVGFRVNRVEGNRLYPQHMPQGLHPGLPLYRSSDQAMERLLSRPSAERKVNVTMYLRATADGFSLQLDNDKPVAMVADHQQADKPQHDNIVRQLSRLGGTPFECREVDIPAGFNYFIPSSLLADLRRQAVAQRLQAVPDRQQPTDGRPQPVPAAKTNAQFRANVANREAARFYGSPTPDAYELQPRPAVPLMQCRHCLRYALGCCVRRGGRRPSWHEPLSLRLADGRTFPLEFDCQHCQMNVYAPSR